MNVSVEFVYITMEEISGLFNIAKQLYYSNYEQFYYTILNQIILLGKEKGFLVKVNLRLDKYDKDKRNKIDVIWRTNDNIIAAFNVESLFISKSIESLAYFNALYRVYIFRSIDNVYNEKLKGENLFLEHREYCSYTIEKY